MNALLPALNSPTITSRNSSSSCSIECSSAACCSGAASNLASESAEARRGPAALPSAARPDRVRGAWTACGRSSIRNVAGRLRVKNLHRRIGGVEDTGGITGCRPGARTEVAGRDRCRRSRQARHARRRAGSSSRRQQMYLLPYPPSSRPLVRVLPTPLASRSPLARGRRPSPRLRRDVRSLGLSLAAPVRVRRAVLDDPAVDEAAVALPAHPLALVERHAAHAGAPAGGRTARRGSSGARDGSSSSGTRSPRTSAPASACPTSPGRWDRCRSAVRGGSA